VLLLSTDPAHSLSVCLDADIGSSPVTIASGLTAIEINGGKEFDSLRSQYRDEIKGFLGAISPNLDLTFDREVMERMIDLSPPGLDEVMALTMAMGFLGKDTYDILILDAAPTGHLIRLLELPELIDQWLKAFFHLFLKYRQIFRLPRISQRMVEMSKNLKKFRGMLRDPEASGLCAVSILTEMAFEETKDLIEASNRIGLHPTSLFLNMATPTPQSPCLLCSALHSEESGIRQRFHDTFPHICQAVVYYQREPRGLNELQRIGRTLYEGGTTSHIAQGR
jgi:arsenite-transporting ATPase